MERPDSVRRVMPPMTTMAKIMAATANSQMATWRSSRRCPAASVGEGKAMASLMVPRPLKMAFAAGYLAQHAARSQRLPPCLVQCQVGAAGAYLARRDEPGGRDPDGVELALEAAAPELEEPVQDREVRRQVVVLPRIALQQAGMVGEIIEDLRRRQPVAAELRYQAGHDASESVDHAPAWKCAED